MVGNSSSGILEVPSFKIATINIGSRQDGRIQSNSVINCSYKTKDISRALDKIYDHRFKKILKKASIHMENLVRQKRFTMLSKDIET